jgi:hypothetical protein
MDSGTHIEDAPRNALFAAFAKISICPSWPAQQPPVRHNRVDPCFHLVVDLARPGKLCLLDEQALVHGLDPLQFCSLAESRAGVGEKRRLLGAGWRRFGLVRKTLL